MLVIRRFKIDLAINLYRNLRPYLYRVNTFSSTWIICYHVFFVAWGAFNNYMDRISPFLTHPLLWTVFIPWAWTKTDIFWPPPLVHVVIEWPHEPMTKKTPQISNFLFKTTVLSVGHYVQTRTSLKNFLEPAMFCHLAVLI